MMMLERRLHELRAQRVAARRKIEQIRWCNLGCPIDRRQFIELQEQFLRGTEREWQELHAMLGRHLPTKPVSLTPRPIEIRALERQRQQAAAARKAQPERRRSLDLHGPYLTRAMMPERTS
jgi:hypothetical protein